jgi:DNA (cytosine-5)-methyltransferase 1
MIVTLDQQQNTPGVIRQSSCFEPQEKPKVVDLCCGMGGLSLGAQQLGMEVVAGVDINSHALRTFSRNFPAAVALHGSVRSKKVIEQCTELLSDCAVTVVVSGPPCQGFSVAGPRDPMDSRNQILSSVGKVITTLRPTIALVENVAAVLEDDHDERILEFEEVLFHGGYSVAPVLLDAADFGVPQKRRRAFFLITQFEMSQEEIERKLRMRKKPKVSVRQALSGLASPELRPLKYKDEEDIAGISNHLAMRHSERVQRKIAQIEPGKGPMSYRRLHPDRPSNTLFSGHRAPPAHYSEARSITVREAARLQGFPDEFRIFGSFGNQMEQVTNSVPPPLANAVLSVLTDMLHSRFHFE